MSTNLFNLTGLAREVMDARPVSWEQVASEFNVLVRESARYQLCE
ncbi:hypothetical protein LMG18090_00264 [Ralstonia mannitolilytica]|nr:hypothetical protein [Ralstonia mannitolilytica]CAJ0774007.1 hypothetical protein LMG18090_00264 [Ralstonia mannitolilytica]